MRECHMMHFIFEMLSETNNEANQIYFKIYHLHTHTHTHTSHPAK